MDIDHLKSKGKVVGVNQTKKAISDKSASIVYIAADANPVVTAPLKTLAQTAGLPVVVVDTMKQLGEACGIDVGASAAAVLEQQ